MARTWFITGISNGFGRQMAEQLLARGDRVAGTTRRPGSVTDLAARYGDRFWVAELDLTDFSAIAKVIDKAFAELGRIDVVVNNAGYGQFGAAEAMSDTQISEQIDTNLIGPIHLARAALPHLRAQGGGRLVAMSSYGGQATHPGASLYHASKWGLEGFFDALAAEVAPFDIAVTIVEPGSARTGFRSQAGERLGRELEAYRDTPIGAIRSRLSDPSAATGGDPARMVGLLIECLDQELAPKRIVIGGDAYRMIETALRDRLSALEMQKAVAIAADAP